MADDKQSGGGNSLIVLAVAAVSAAYFAWQKPQLEGFRPAETLHQAYDVRGLQDVEARLWQDPLKAVEEKYEKDRKNTQSMDEYHAIKNARDYLNGSLVLGITVPGGPYHEDSETRRRLRYAVLAALHAANYVPYDEKHLAYFRTEHNEPANRTERFEVGSALNVTLTLRLGDDKPRVLEPSLPTLIPVEKFKSQEQTEDEVSVLWLNEDVVAVSEKPIESIKKLLCQLNLEKAARFAILGPQDSTTLISVLTELKSWNKESKSFSLGCDKPVEWEVSMLPIYNFGATADENILLRRAAYENENKLDPVENKIEKLLATFYIDYYRPIYTDKALPKSLRKELELRNLDTRSDHVVLMFESDTVYGRSLRDTIAREFTDDKSGPLQIDPYSYLRGLDGQIPRNETAEKKSSVDENDPNGNNRPASDSSKGSSTQNEIADGQGQFDYLQRLANHLHELDNELRHDGTSKIAAVGILGSDVYDKHLLVEALKPELPQAVFFTTDLDALLLPHGNFRFTRNLIVASSYGLELSDWLQSDIPPFRNAYQTSIFLATRLAIRNELANSPETRQKTRDALARWFPQTNPRAKVFQVGRSRIQSLNSNEIGAGSARDKDILDYLSIDPIGTSSRFFPDIKSGGSVIPAGFLVAILFSGALFTSGRLRHFCFPRQKLPASWYSAIQPRLGWLLVVLTLAVLVGLALSASWSFVADWLTENGEPMLLLQGISVWPTVFLRAVSCALGIWLIAYTLKSLETDLDDRQVEMCLWDWVPYVPRWQAQSLARRWYEMATLMWCRPDTGAVEPNDNAETKSSEDSLSNQISKPQEETAKMEPQRALTRLWMTYCYYGQRRWRLARAVVATVGMIALWLVLSKIFGEPNAPARGFCSAPLFLDYDDRCLSQLTLDLSCRRRDSILPIGCSKYYRHRVTLAGGAGRKIQGTIRSRPSQSRRLV